MDFPVEQYLEQGVDPSEPIVLPEAVGVLSLDRDEHLVAALAKCINVRSIKIESDIAVFPSWFQRFEKLRELSVTSYDLKSLPAWLSGLKDLRHLSLDSCSSLKGIPEHVWRIPRLESLWLFHTTFESLAGIEHAPALRELVIHSDELEPQIPAIAERLRKARGVTRVTLDGTTSPTLRIERKATVRLPGSARKNAQILSQLPRGFDCRGIDLRGQTFEDLDIEVDLRNANLDGTTWRRCRFQHTDMTGSSAAKATFDHCQFDGSPILKGAKAPGVAFTSCNLGAGSMEGADLRDATFADTAPDSFLRLSGCKLSKATIEAVYTTPQNGTYVDLSKADLRGARVCIRLTTEAADRLKNSKTRFTWKKANTKGAKTDKHSVIEHVVVGQEKAEKPTGPASTSIGTLCGANAACWFVVADAQVARGWKGSQLDENYEELPKTDFSRAMTARKGAMKIGDGHGVLADVGDCGCSRLWVDGNTWCLLYAHESEDVDRRSKEGERLIGMRVAQLKAKRTTKVGTFEVRAGCMTLLVPYRENPFTENQIAAATKSGKVRGVANDHDALLVPVPNGLYEVTYEDLSHTDEVGSFYTRIRIAPAGTKPVKGAASRGRKIAGKRRYFEFIGGGSSKFWEIRLAGTSFTTRFGKIGTDGQTSTKDVGSVEKAQREHDKLVAEKIGKGYQESARPSSQA